MIDAVAPLAAQGSPRAPHRPRGERRWRPYLGVAPFFAYIGVFLIWPTCLVVVGAFRDGAGQPSLSGVRTLGQSVYLQAFGRSVTLAAVTAVAGAVLGALLAWAISEGPSGGLMRRVVVAGCSVLAQFGGVMLAFAFLATIGLNGLVTLFLQRHFGIDLVGDGSWLYELPGLAVVYTYFQIPLMLIVFLPAIDSLKPQWAEACHSLGGTSWTYWRRVAGPALAPAFLGALLLLFANAFSAYATAAALVSQGSPIVPLQIRDFLTSEVILGNANLGKALAFGMVIVVAAVMALYSLLQRRTSRWLR